MPRRSHPRLLRPAAVALALVGVPAAAQVAPAPPARTASGPAGTFLAGAGPDLGGWDHVLGRRTPGLGLQLGYERRVGPAGSRFALRFAGDYWRSGRHELTYVRPAAEGVPYRRSSQVYGANALGVFQLRAGGAVRPYALAGIGVYQTVSRNQATVGGGTLAVLPLRNDRVTSLAYTAGLGVSARVGRVTPFAELRFVQLDNLAGLGRERTNVSATRTPLTVGVRASF